MDDYRLETQQRLMSGDRDAVVGKKISLAKANCFKIKISKKKCRYRDHFYDLDLAYITKRIIVMGYPATGLDRIGRNSSSDIISFLSRYHKDHAKVLHCCSKFTIRSLTYAKNRKDCIIRVCLQRKDLRLQTSRFWIIPLVTQGNNYIYLFKS
jgi:hypothetical protein